jgi:hypothetical protein
MENLILVWTNTRVYEPTLGHMNLDICFKNMHHVLWTVAYFMNRHTCFIKLDSRNNWHIVLNMYHHYR